MGASKLYNFMWIYRELSQSNMDEFYLVDYRPGLARIGMREVPLRHVKAVILYPSLLTPGIVMRNQPIEILLLAHASSPELTVAHVNQQLKICKGLEKGFDKTPLFNADPASKIIIQPAPGSARVNIAENPEILETITVGSQSAPTMGGNPTTSPGNFSGLLHSTALRFLQGKNYTVLYKIVITGTDALFATIDRKTSSNYVENGKIRKRYYYYDVEDGDWLEKILAKHDIVNPIEGRPFTDTTSHPHAWDYIKDKDIKISNMVSELAFNRGFVRDPVLFRDYNSEDIPVPAYPGSAPSSSRFIGRLQRRLNYDRKENYPVSSTMNAHDEPVEEYAADGNFLNRMATISRNNGDPVMGGTHDGSYKRCKDTANHLIIYQGERVFVPDEEGTHELHDQLVLDELYDMHGEGINDRGLYCFGMKMEKKASAHTPPRPEDYEGKDVDMTQLRYDRPIIPYHPVFYYHNNTNAVFNIGHATDLHIYTAPQVLKKSNARVIEYRMNGNEADTNISPEIGTRVQSNARNSKELLEKFGTNPAVDVVVLTGDFVDYMMGLYVKKTDSITAAHQVWDAVDLGDAIAARQYMGGPNPNDNYKQYSSYIAFYSLLIDFYKRYNKPVFAVAGNHDCYMHPYGISPRAYVDRTILGGMRRIRGESRTDDTVPYDHNLTQYEAILAFGKSFHILRSTVQFNRDNFKWFHLVCTPFSDYSLLLSKQVFVGLGWGDDEVMATTESSLVAGMDPALREGDQGDHGFGHLPRACQTFSDMQYNILNQSITKRGRNVSSPRKVVLFSHFTFASYGNYIPSEDRRRIDETANGEGEVNARNGRYAPRHYDYGTFHLRRNDVYGFIKNNQIHCILTGHSHRSGIYRLSNMGPFNADAWFYPMPATLSNVPNPGSGSDRNSVDGTLYQTVIISSDSGGPTSRYNEMGEFFGYGMHHPAGTLVVFDPQSAVVSQTQKLTVGAKRRFAVALDFVSLNYDGNRFNNTLLGRGEGAEENVRGNRPRTPVEVYTEFAADNTGDVIFTLVLNPAIALRAGTNPIPDIIDRIAVERVVLYSRAITATPGMVNWRKLELASRGRSADRTYRFSVVDPGNTGQTTERRNTFGDITDLDNRNLKRFIGVKFNSQNAPFSHYDFNDWWTFEFQVEERDHRFHIIRDTRYRGNAEIPDFQDDRINAVYGAKYPSRTAIQQWPYTNE